MGIELLGDKVAAISGYCKNLKCGWAGNWLNFQNIIDTENKIYSVFVPTSDVKVEFKGAITWGNTGFEFKFYLDNENIPVEVIEKYRNCNLSQEKCTEILKKIISISKDKLKTKALKMETDKTKPKKGGGLPRNYLGPLLLACKFNRSQSKKSENNIEKYRNSDVFCEEFAEFLLRHKNYGLRCHSHVKKGIAK